MRGARINLGAPYKQIVYCAIIMTPAYFVAKY